MADIEKLARIAWKNFQRDGRKWRQSLTDDEGEAHYCLAYNYNQTLLVHGVWDRTTGNYRVVRYKFDAEGNPSEVKNPHKY